MNKESGWTEPTPPSPGFCATGEASWPSEPDGTWSIAYSPLTLPDGTVTAGFYLRPLHKSLGNYALGQVALVENCPRTVTPGALYDWQLPEGYHRDERQARLASGAGGLLPPGDGAPGRRWPWMTVDGGTTISSTTERPWSTGTGWGCGAGTRGAAFQEVRFGVMCGGEPVFAGEEGVYTLDGTAAWDYLPEKTPIEGVWQSGPVELDRVRTVTRAGLLLRPESGSGLVLSLATDRRGAWGACPAGAGRLRYSQVDYGRWSYNPSPLPQRRFLRLRARKCTACRLTLRPRGPGCRGSVEEIWMEMT